MGSGHKHIASVSPRWMLDVYMMVASAIGMYERGEITAAILKAVLKLHSMSRPSSWLELPEKTKAKVDTIISTKEFYKPLYPWQSAKACKFSSFGGGEISCDNCLGVAGARRYLKFFRAAWKRNVPVPYIEKHDRHMSAFAYSVRPEGRPLKFRDFELSQALHKVLRQAESFKRPSMIYDFS